MEVQYDHGSVRETQVRAHYNTRRHEEKRLHKKRETGAAERQRRSGNSPGKSALRSAPCPPQPVDHRRDPSSGFLHLRLRQQRAQTETHCRVQHLLGHAHRLQHG
jgi:hypothetical protein